MTINQIKANGIFIAEITSDKIEITTPQDALEIMVNCGYQGAEAIIFYTENITPAFFDLKTKIAGEVLQKFSNYKMHLAIVGDFTPYASKSLSDFILESNKQRLVNFVSSRDEAIERLTRRAL